MSAPLLKKWGHMRAAPFAEIADLLEQQDQALARSSAQLKEGVQRLMEAAALCRAADAKIAQLVAALEACEASASGKGMPLHSDRLWKMVRLALGNARGGQ